MEVKLYTQEEIITMVRGTTPLNDGLCDSMEKIIEKEMEKGTYVVQTPSDELVEFDPFSKDQAN